MVSGSVDDAFVPEGRTPPSGMEEERLLTPQGDVSSGMGPIHGVVLAGNQGASEERGTSCVPFPALPTHTLQ